MSVKLLTEHHLEFLSFTGGCTGSSESTLVKMPHCWKSHVTAQFVIISRLPLICTGLLLVFGIHHIHDEIDPSFHYGIDQVRPLYREYNSLSFIEFRPNK